MLAIKDIFKKNEIEQSIVIFIISVILFFISIYCKLNGYQITSIIIPLFFLSKDIFIYKLWKYSLKKLLTVVSSSWSNMLVYLLILFCFQSNIEIYNRYDFINGTILSVGFYVIWGGILIIILFGIYFFKSRKGNI